MYKRRISQIHVFETKIFQNSSSEHVASIGDSLILSSIASLMHQLYRRYRKHWWLFDFTSTFHPCFQCFSTLERTMLHRVNINEITMNHRWRRNGEFRCSMADFKARKNEFHKIVIHHFQSNWTKFLVKKLIGEAEEQFFRSPIFLYR